MENPICAKSRHQRPHLPIGVVVHLPDGPVDVGALPACADRAMYRAKRKGKNCVAMAPAAGAGEAVGNFAA